jgi:hypothetical protein
LYRIMSCADSRDMIPIQLVPFNDLEADSMIYIAGSLRDFLVDGVGLDVFNCVV